MRAVKGLCLRLSQGRRPLQGGVDVGLEVVGAHLVQDGIHPALRNENVAGDIDGYNEDYFMYIFGTGQSGIEKVPVAHRQMIRQGKVGVGYTKAEVRLAKGSPKRKISTGNGRFDWIYDNGVVVKFSSSGRVLKVHYR